MPIWGGSTRRARHWRGYVRLRRSSSPTYPIGANPNIASSIYRAYGWQVVTRWHKLTVRHIIGVAVNVVGFRVVGPKLTCRRHVYKQYSMGLRRIVIISSAVPQIPPVECQGRRPSWLDWLPRTWQRQSFPPRTDSQLRARGNPRPRRPDADYWPSALCRSDGGRRSIARGYVLSARPPARART